MNPLSARYRDVVAAFRVLDGQDRGAVGYVEMYAQAEDPCLSPRAAARQVAAPMGEAAWRVAARRQRGPRRRCPWRGSAAPMRARRPQPARWR